MNNLASLLASFLTLISFFPQSQQASVITVDPTDLVSNVSNQIDSRLAQSDSSNPSSVLAMYTSWTKDATTPWPRNMNSWTQKGTPLDFTGIAAWNDSRGYQQTATMITPPHYVNANHFSLTNGTTVKFIDRNGNPVVRKVVTSTTIPATDINVGELDADVDTSIAHYLLVDGASLHSRIAIPCTGSDTMPIAVFNQNAEALIHKFQSDSSTYIGHDIYTTGTRAPFSKSLVGGDSSQPGFMIVNNQPVLLFTNYQANEGPNLGYYINDINNIISGFKDGTGYKVSTYDLSGFKTYSTCLEADPGPLAITSINPTSAKAGALIAVTGTGFNLKNNTAHLKNGSVDKTVTGIPAGSTYLQFNLPASTDIDPGTYMLSIQNSKGDISNEVSLAITSAIKPTQTTQGTTQTTTPAQTTTSKPTYILNVVKSGAGRGVVKNNYIYCGTTCTQPSINSGDTITLTATPDTGYVFSGWSGGSCSGTGNCVIRVSSNTSVTATFSIAPDTTAPTITSVSSNSPTSSGVTITWTTNESANSQVEYGLTTSYGSITTVNTSLTTTHTVSFGSLTPDTKYHYRVKSADGSSNVTTSSDYTFATVPLPVTPKPTPVANVQPAVSQATSTATPAVVAPAVTPIVPPVVTQTTYDLLINKTGSGSGSVDGGLISCGGSCIQSNIPQGTSITLTATPDFDSKFVTWSGGGCGEDTTCTIKILSDITLNAIFSSVSNNQTSDDSNNTSDPYAQSPQFHYENPNQNPSPNQTPTITNDNSVDTPVYTQTYTPTPQYNPAPRTHKPAQQVKPADIVLLPETKTPEVQKETPTPSKISQAMQAVGRIVQGVYQRIINGVENVVGGTK